MQQQKRSTRAIRSRTATTPTRAGAFRLAAASVLAAATTAHAASIWSNAIADANPSAANPFTAGQTFDANLTVSGVGRGGGINPNAGSNRYNATAWSTTQDANDYFYWTLTPNAGYEIDFGSVSGAWQRSSTGPNTYSLQYSINGGTFAQVGTGGISGSGSASNYNLALGDTALDKVATPITFRLFAWGGTSASGTFSINDFVFDGLVTPAQPVGPTYFWIGNDGALGGDGTWDASASPSWSASDTTIAPAVWDSSKSAFFKGPGGAIAVSGTVSVDANLQFDSGGYALTGGTISLGGATPTITVTNAADTARIGSQIASGSGLTKSGAGTLILDADNSYGGGTVVSSGTLQVGNGGTTGSVTGPIAVNGNLAFNRSDDVSVVNEITGPGSLTKLGNNTLTLNANAAHTGGTTIAAGTLQVGDGGSLAGNVTNNGMLAFNQSGDTPFAGNVSGAGALVKHGPGTLVLTGNVAHTGGTTINAGTLQVGDGNFTGSLAGDVVNNGTLAFFRSGNVTLPGNVTGSGALRVQMGIDKLIVTGNVALTGGTTIESGTLQVGSGGATGTLAGDVVNGGTLAFNRSGESTFAGNVSGGGNLTKAGSGAVTLSGNNTHTGGTTVTAGALRAGFDNALGDVNVPVTVSGGKVLATAGTTVANAIVVNGASTSGPTLLAFWGFGNQTANPVSGDPGTFNTSGSAEVYDPATKTLSVASAGSVADSAVVNLSDLAGTMGGSGGNNWGTFGGTPINEVPPGGTGALTVQGSANNGKSVVFQLSTAGYADLVASYAYRSTGTGFDSQDWSYSLDGTNFTPVATVPLTKDSAFHDPASVVDLSAVADVENKPVVYLKVTYNGATAGTGNTRIDNVQFNAVGSSAGNTVALGSDTASGTATFSGNVTLNSSVDLTSAGGGTAVFSGTIADGSASSGITKVGAGTVRLTNANSYSGGTRASEGLLAAAHPQALSNGVVTIDGTGKVAAEASLALASVTIADSGQLDVTSKSITVATSDAGVAAQLYGYVSAAYDHGDWDLPGIGSSIAAADATGATAVGYAFDGSQARIAYTWYGDADLNGVVNADDVGLMSFGSNKTWGQGDFNYDGQVTADDFALLSVGLAVSGGSPIAPIPEPAALLGVLSLAPAALVRRRPRAK